MRRHELDVFSLVAGVVFLTVAVGHLVDEAGDFDFDARWVLPVAMVAIGVAGLATLAGKDRAAVRAPAGAGAETETGMGTWTATEPEIRDEPEIPDETEDVAETASERDSATSEPTSESTQPGDEQAEDR